MTSHWRITARQVIEEAVATFLRERSLEAGAFERRRVLSALSADQGQELLQRVSAAYPFFGREMYPYKIWLQEVKALRLKLGPETEVAEELFAEADPCPA